MSRYYDHKSVSCEGCIYLTTDTFPNGKPYEACGWFGYILHPEKGISDEPCTARSAEKKQPRATSLRTLGKSH